MVHSNELDPKTTGLDDVSGVHRNELRAGLLVELGQPVAQQAECKRSAPHSGGHALEQEGKGAGVVFVSVSEHNADDALGVGQHIRHVRDNQVDARAV